MQMIDNEMYPTREVTTFAHVSTAEDIAFYGEFAEAYSEKFRKFKNNMGLVEQSPSLSFLAYKGFKGYCDNDFQKKEDVAIMM